MLMITSTKILVKSLQVNTLYYIPHYGKLVTDLTYTKFYTLNIKKIKISNLCLNPSNLI